MRIGVISDTHGLLRPEAIAALQNTDLILHAGDVGDPKILDRLREVAPVAAVRGNVDRGLWADALSTTEVVAAQGLSIYMLHNLDDLDLKPKAAGIHVVIYGHSHHPKMEEKNGVFYFNPGSAGPRRFQLPVTVGMLEIESGNFKAQLIPLISP
jgi:uncharacterized protein